MSNNEGVEIHILVTECDAYLSKEYFKNASIRDSLYEGDHGQTTFDLTVTKRQAELLSFADDEYKTCKECNKLVQELDEDTELCTNCGGW